MQGWDWGSSEKGALIAHYAFGKKLELAAEPTEGVCGAGLKFSVLPGVWGGAGDSKNTDGFLRASFSGFVERNCGDATRKGKIDEARDDTFWLKEKL